MAKKLKGIFQETAEAYTLINIPYEGYVQNVSYQSLMAIILGSYYFQERNYAIPEFVPVMDSSPEMRIQSIGGKHKVSSGETPFSISQYYGVSISSIMSANRGIDWPNARNNGELIFAGETLALPKGTTEEQLPKAPPPDIALPYSANMVRKMMERRGVSSNGGAWDKWMNNSDPFMSVGISSKTGIGVGGKISVLGVQFGVNANAYTSKRSGTISNKITSGETKISNIAVNYLIFGVEYERDWMGKNNMGSFDIGPLHFESGKYPVLRIFSASFQTSAGAGIDVDVNLGTVLNNYGKSQMYHYNSTGGVMPTFFNGF